MIVLLEQRWACPNCTSEAITRDAKIPFHPCGGLAGLNAPLVPSGTKCKVEAVERGDYVGNEVVQTDGEGRPVMAVITTRDDGQDCAILAPLATAERD